MPERVQEGGRDEQQSRANAIKSFGGLAPEVTFTCAFPHRPDSPIGPTLCVSASDAHCALCAVLIRSN